MHWNSTQLICCDVTMHSFSSPLEGGGRERPFFNLFLKSHTKIRLPNKHKNPPPCPTPSQATNTVREGKSRVQGTLHTAVLPTTGTELNRENQNRTSRSSLQTCKFKWNIKKGTGLSSRLLLESLLNTVRHCF